MNTWDSLSRVVKDRTTGDVTSTDTRPVRDVYAQGMMAPQYIALTFPVAAGAHCIYEGELYAAKQDIAASEAWTAAHWDNVQLGAEVAKVGASVADLKSQSSANTNALDRLIYGKRVFSDDVKTALFALLEHLVYTDEHGQDYISALETALTPVTTLASIEAVFNQGSAEITDQDNLDALRAYLTVIGTYAYPGGTYTDTILDYTLSGTLEVGTSTITVTVGNLTDTFNVTVTEYTDYAIYQQLNVTRSSYIVTDITEVDLDNCSFEYVAIPANDYATSGHIMSSNSNFVPYPQCYSTSLIRRINLKLKGADAYYGDASNPAWNLNEELHIVAYANGGTSVVANDVTIIAGVTPGSSVPSASNKYAIFAYGGNVTKASYRYKGALKYFKIYNALGETIHSFVPAIKKSAQKAGLYDQITDTFYSSATDTEFTVE